MKKTSTFLIHNLWWLIPFFVIIFFWQHTSPILLMLVFAYFGQIILNPLVKLIDNWISDRRWSVFIVIVFLIILLGILSISIFPFIRAQIVTLQSALSMDTFQTLQEKLKLIIENILPVFLFNMLSDLMVNLDISISEIWAAGLSQIKSLIGSAGSVAFALGSALLSSLILIVFIVFFLIQGEQFTNAFLHAIPGNNYGLAKRMLQKTTQQVHAYIRGQLLAGSSVAISSIIFLYILQWMTGIYIPYTIIIGITAGFFNLIPFIGPIMGLIPAVVIYLITDQTIPIHIFYLFLIIGVFAIVQLIDNLVMSPYLMGSSVGIHPMLVIIIVLFGASVGGILGMVFAVPITAILKVTTEELVIAFKK